MKYIYISYWNLWFFPLSNLQNGIFFFNDRSTKIANPQTHPINKEEVKFQIFFLVVDWRNWDFFRGSINEIWTPHFHLIDKICNFPLSDYKISDFYPMTKWQNSRVSWSVYKMFWWDIKNVSKSLSSLYFFSYYYSY